MPAIPRRLLRGALTLALVGTVASCSTPLARGTADVREPAAGRARAAGTAADQRIRTTESVLQVVAHPDDDLYFMNPDLSQSLRSGNALATVYLTAGESNGVNASAEEARRKQLPADRAKFAKARQNGIRAAYARMATGDSASPWRREVVPTDGGGEAELDTLRAHPKIRLVWLQLHEAESIGRDRPHSLRGLWDGRVSALNSLLASGSVVSEDFAYSGEQLVSTLTGLLERFRPTYVRMQDPTPDSKRSGIGWTDHQDHMYGARFLQRALARYAEEPDRPLVGTQVYLGYLNGSLPHTLDRTALRTKLDAIRTYGWTDGRDCRDSAGCGDLKVGARPLGFNWAQSIRYHRGESTSWLQPQRNGALRAFATLDGRLAVWSQRTRGSAQWSGPDLLPGAGIDDGVTSLRLRDGRIAVFATRTLLGTGPADYRRELVTTAQTVPGGRFGPWESLGAPGPDAVSSWQLGAPAVTLDGSGRATVYLRNPAHGLSSRTRNADGSWQPWTDLGGTGLLGNLAVATDRKGRMHVLAATPASVLAWSQPRRGAAMGAPEPTGLPATTGPLTAHPDATGVRLYFRRPGSADLLTAHSPSGSSSASASGSSRAGRSVGGAVGTSGRTWRTEPADLGGIAGFGPVEVTPQGAGVLLTARDARGTVSAARYAPADNAKGRAGTGGSAAGRSAAERSAPERSAAGRSGGGGATAGRSAAGRAAAGRPRALDWEPGRFLFSGAPAGARSGTAGPAVAAIGLDGRLYWTRTGRTPDLAPWRPATGHH
ncbi:PIG-L family deacetylase [Streptomyces sp. NPDC002055]|uniref:PIG-L family deacetylase n=1 Tax=Streptomyces sp. NPDC002055 TaxID=3154534 RepID=UPI0033263046